MRRTRWRFAAAGLAALIGGGVVMSATPAKAADPLPTRITFEVIDDNGDGTAEAPMPITFDLSSNYSKMRAKVEAKIGEEWYPVGGISVRFEEYHEGDHYRLCTKATAATYDLRPKRFDEVGADDQTLRSRLLGRADCDPGSFFPGEKCFPNPMTCRSIYPQKWVSGEQLLQATVHFSRDVEVNGQRYDVDGSFAQTRAVLQQAPISSLL